MSTMISTQTLGLSAPHVISGRRVRLAIVGCGRISKNHLAAIETHSSDIELVGLCDTEPERLEAAIASTGVPGYLSLPELLADAHPDVVVLATPSGLHARQAIEAAEAGCHVVTEKPMATRWEDGRRMVEVFDRAGLRLFVIKQNRKNPTLQMLKRATEKRRFGRIYMVEVNVFWTRPQEYYDSERWRGKWEFDGGALMNQASHYVDLLDWIVGPVESVQAYIGTLARHIEVEDSGVVGIKWRSGALGSLNVTMLTYPKNMEGSITILGERGTVRIGGVAANEIQRWEFDTPDPDDALAAEVSYKPLSVYGNGHSLYYENVIEVLRGVCEPDTDGREGLRSLELLTAMYISGRDGRRVSLPLEPLMNRNGTALDYFVHSSAIVDAGAAIGAGTKVWHWAHVCATAQIGRNCTLGQNVFVGAATIGNNVKIQNNVSVYEGVTIEDDVFCGPSMVFTNVINPRSHVPRRHEFQNTLVRRGATIGANAVIVCGHTIGSYAMVGAGAVVTKDVADFALVVGNPARRMGWVCQCGLRLQPSDGQARCAGCDWRYDISPEICRPLSVAAGSPL